MRNKILFLFSVSLCFFLLTGFSFFRKKTIPAGLADPPGLIQVDSAAYSREAPDRFTVSANLTNTTGETREVVCRAQLSFFDKTSPAGDVPLFILRKDQSIILKSGETKNMNVFLINEGSLPRGALRIEPLVRVRRHREWIY